MKTILFLVAALFVALYVWSPDWACIGFGVATILCLLDSRQ